MLSIKEIRKKGKKPATSILHKFLQEVSVYLTRIFLYLPLTPNQITFLWVVLQLSASLLLLKGTYVNFLMGVSLFQFGKLLDSVDGQIARIRKKTTLMGIYLDVFAHNITIPFFFICLTLGVFTLYKNQLYLLFGAIAVISYWYGRILAINPLWFKDKQNSIINKNFNYAMRKRFIWIYDYLKPQYPFNLLFFGILLGFPHYTLAFYSALFFIDTIRKSSLIFLKLKKIGGR